MSKDALDQVLADEIDKKNTVVSKEVNANTVDSQIVQEASSFDLNSDFMPGVGVDIGTSNIVVARRKKDGTFVNRYHRNMLYPLDVSSEAMDLLEKSSYLYVKVDDSYYVVGEDALTLVNAIGKGEIVRPMKDGILNPSLEGATELLFYIIKAVVGDPICNNETLRFSVPADPVDAPINNKFHEMVLTNVFKKMGYQPKPVNEAMCVAYDCNPVMKSETEIPLSGIVMSNGGGMTNIALCYKGLSLQEFSVTKSGDYIDEQTALMTGSKKGKVIKIKEKGFDLNNYSFDNRIHSALSVYYEEMMERMIYYASEKFKGLESEMDGSIELVVAGGTSMVPGFCEKIYEKIKLHNFPFNIYRVRHSKTPFYSVSQGACIRAQADFKKI